MNPAPMPMISALYTGVFALLLVAGAGRSRPRQMVMSSSRTPVPRGGITGGGPSWAVMCSLSWLMTRR